MSTLNFAELTFVPGINIWDKETPAGHIWHSTLQYIQSCPGYQGCWASGKFEKVKLLTSWADDDSYTQFQCSMGVSLSVGFFAKGLIQYRLSLKDFELGGSDGIVCLAVVLFEEVKSSEERLSFEREVFEGLSSQNDPNRICYKGEWLESSYESFSLTFIGIVLGQKESEHTELDNLEEIPSLLETRLKLRVPSHTRECTIFVPVEETFLARARNSHLRAVTSDSLPRPITLSSLLRVDPLVKFTPWSQRKTHGGSADSGCTVRYTGTGPEDPEWKILGYPTPSGRYTAMLALDQKADLQVPGKRLVHRFHHPDTKFSLDVIQLVFKPSITIKFQDNRDVWWDTDPETFEGDDEADGENETDEDEKYDEDRQLQDHECGEYNRLHRPDFVPAKEAFAWSEMRKKLLGIKGCDRLVYGICKEHKDTVDLLIPWEDPTSRGELNQDRFADLSPYLERPPTIKHFSSFAANWNGERAEMVKFYVPATSNNKEAFEHYYFDFVDSLEVKNPIFGGHHFSSAGSSTQGGWQQDTEIRNGKSVHVYVSLLFWKDEAAEEQWYSDFKAGMMESYERLGHRQDGLRAMVVDVESFHYVFRHHVERQEKDDWDTGGYLF